MYYMYNSSVRAQTHLIAFPLLFLSPFFLYCTKYIDLFFVRWICVCVCECDFFCIGVSANEDSESSENENELNFFAELDSAIVHPNKS